MNTPLISAFLPVASPPPSAGAGAGSVPDGNSFASILSGQQSQFGATQGTASASNGQSVSQQNNAATQTGSASSNASQATQSGSNPGTGSATASSGSSGQQASSSPSGDQSTAAAQGGNSAQSAQEGASGQATNTAGTAGSPGAAQGQSGATAETAAAAAAAEQSQGALAMAGQQAASALLAGLNTLQAEAGPTDALNIDRLAATTDALSGNAMAGQNANGQPGGRNAAASGATALAGLDRPSTQAVAGLQASALNTQANALAGRGAHGAALHTTASGAANDAARVSASAAQITDTTTLTPLASALGGLAGAAAPGSGVGQGLAANGLNGAAVSRGKAALSQAASGAGAPKWGDSALSGSGKAAESTNTFLNLVNSSRLLFTAPDTPALQQAGLNTQEGATLGTLGLAQGAAGQAAVPGGLGATGLPVAAAVSTPLSNPQWGTDFTRTVFNLSQANNQGPMVAEMRLDPPDLGPIRITLTVHDNIMQAAFVSPHAVVRQTVENALPQLQQLLAQAGIALGDASVNDQGTPGQSEQAGQGAGSGAGESGTGGAGGVLAGLEGGPGTVAAAEAARGPVDPNALVDTFA